MNVKPSVRSITEYHLALSEADAQQALDAPYEFAEAVGAQLRAAGLAPSRNAAEPAARPRRKPGARSQIQIGRKARKTRPNGNAPAGKQANSLEPVQCPECPKQIARKYLPNHLLKVHGIATPVTAKNGTHPEPAPAAA